MYCDIIMVQDKLEFRKYRFMKEEILHITNGDYFNNYFTKKIGGIAVPFREVIMDGEVVDIVYSDEFIKLRAKTLNVSENEYRSKMSVLKFYLRTFILQFIYGLEKILFVK